MARTKIDYGIDLGTTNSAIARMETGVPTIKKSEGFQKDTTPSCIHFNKKKTIIAGDKGYNILSRESISAFKKNDPTLINTYIEFKRTMGKDEKYACKNMDKSFSSTELSAEVLKTLKGYVRDEEINSMVITVPAKFQGHQNDATMRAAKLAGFQYCELLQEPIAASMAYGIEAQNIEGEWLVFDFGGGTFDAALMKANEGIMKVIDTEGDNLLGGKNLDLAIVDGIIMPYLKENYVINNIISDDGRKNLLRNAVKRFAEEAKIYLSQKEKLHYDLLTDEPIGEDDEGNVIEIDLTITKEKYEDAVKPYFQQAIELSQKLLDNNNISGADLSTVLMIGGPTFSNTLREMIREKITDKIDVSIDPMTAVATGAALFASTKNIPEGIIEIDKSKIQLKLMYPTDTVEIEEKVGIRVLRDKTEDDIPQILFVELSRQDKGWSSGRAAIKDDAEILEIVLEPGRSNGFSIVITDDKGTQFPSEPSTFSIIQGFKVAGATLPFDLCIDAFQLSAGRQQLTSIKNLQKNQMLPAKGTGVYQTQNDVRPGNKSDQIRIPLFYGEAGTKAIYNYDKLRGEIIITGNDLPNMLPKGSDVELTVDIDASTMINVSACFPYLDEYTIENVITSGERKIPTKKEIEEKLNRAQQALSKLEEEYPEIELVDIEKIRQKLNDLNIELENGGSDGDIREGVFGTINRNMIEMDELESESEWPRVMQEMMDAIEHLDNTDEQFGDEKSTQIIKKLNDQVKSVIEKKDIKMAKDLTKQIGAIDFALVDHGAGVALEISFLKGFDDNFDMHEWKNRNEAKQLLNEAKGIINANRATKENLRPIVGQLMQLLPSAQKSLGNQPDDDVLVK